jgi:hypothetical protein
MKKNSTAVIKTSSETRELTRRTLRGIFNSERLAETLTELGYSMEFEVEELMSQVNNPSAKDFDKRAALKQIRQVIAEVMDKDGVAFSEHTPTIPADTLTDTERLLAEQGHTKSLPNVVTDTIKPPVSLDDDDYETAIPSGETPEGDGLSGESDAPLGSIPNSGGPCDQPPSIGRGGCDEAHGRVRGECDPEPSGSGEPENQSCSSSDGKVEPEALSEMDNHLWVSDSETTVDGCEDTGVPDDCDLRSGDGDQQNP